MSTSIMEYLPTECNSAIVQQWWLLKYLGEMEYFS